MFWRCQKPTIGITTKVAILRRFMALLDLIVCLVYQANRQVYPLPASQRIILLESKKKKKRIDGDNLYNVWHQFSDEQRRQVIKQLCGYLKVINDTDIRNLPKDVELPPVPKWRNVILGQIDNYLKSAQVAGTLKPEDISAVKQYSERHAGSLDEQVIALVFWDVHFDNFLVKGDKIVGLLDLERTELASIDFVLNTVKRMVDFPKKYASEYAEQFVKGEDYARILDWYKEFYPELFKFRNLERRLDLYALAHDLKDLEGWPNVQELKDNIRAICL